MPSVVLCFSGGIDSTVLLWELIRQGRPVHCLTVDYGQPAAAQERAHADALFLRARLIRGATVTHRVVSVPVGDQLFGSDGPGRLFDRVRLGVLGLAAAYALAKGADTLAFASRVDTMPYDGFHIHLAHLISELHGDRLAVFAPFAEQTRAAIFRRGLQLLAPIADTWSCVGGAELHCGDCLRCRRRRRGHMMVARDDRTRYALAAAELAGAPTLA